MSDDEEYIDHLPKIIYPLTPKTSSHRKLVVDKATKVWLPVSFKSIQSTGHPVDFLADLGTALPSTVRDGGVKAVGAYEFFKGIDACVYHEHTITKTPCYQVQRGS